MGYDRRCKQVHLLILLGDSLWGKSEQSMNQEEKINELANNGMKSRK